MADKKVLVVVSHGSKRKESNQEFREFIEKLNQINSESKKNNGLNSSVIKNDNLENADLRGSYNSIRGACLEFASPQLETVTEELIVDRLTSIDVLPLFIFSGYHVRQDIPQRLQLLQEKYQELEYQILKHPAADNDFAGYIFKHALEQSKERI